MSNIKNVIKKTLELCQERLQNNVLLVEGSVSLCKTAEFTKAGLPIKRYFNVCEMNPWELQKLPVVPGTYVFEGMEKLDSVTADTVYGWALRGKKEGVRVIFVSTNYPRAVQVNAQTVKV